MKNKIWLLIKCIALPLFVGILSGILIRNGVREYGALEKPFLSPPGFLFPIVWTILYVLMGIGSYLVLINDGKSPISIYGWQLIVNFLWPTFFFNFKWYLFSFFWLLLLWGLVAVMLAQFYRVSKVAAYLNVPYLVWLTFAAYLNLGVYLLNR